MAQTPQLAAFTRPASPLPHLFCYKLPQKGWFVGRFDRSVVRIAVVGLLIGLGLTLSGCGRKGPLDPPPAALSGPQPNALQTDQQGRDIAPPGQKKRIPLDVLLD